MPTIETALFARLRRLLAQRGAQRQGDGDTLEQLSAEITLLEICSQTMLADLATLGRTDLRAALEAIRDHPEDGPDAAAAMRAIARDALP
jgi:hypothetical protein